MYTATDMNVTEAGTPTQLSTSAVVQDGGEGNLLGVFVSSATSGTLKFWNNNAASGTVIVDTFTPVVGVFTPLPFQYTNGLYVTIGGTIVFTVSTQKSK